MDAFDPNTSESDLGEMLESFRWTQRLAQRLVLDPALAADVSQDAWTRALERFGSRLPDRVWLAGTIKSLAFRGRRSRRRRAHHENQVPKADSEISAAEVIERSETQQRVARAVKELAPEQRVVVLLRFQEGLSLSAIALQLECSKSAAADRVQAALSELRRKLGAETNSTDWRACLLLAMPAGSASLPVPAHVEPAPPLGSAAVPPSLGPPLLLGVSMGKFSLLAALVVGLALVANLTLSRTRALKPDPVAASELGDTHLVSSPLESTQEPTSMTAVDSESRTGLAEREPLSAEFDPASFFIFTGNAVDGNGAPVPYPKIEVESRDWKRDAIGTEEGQFELRLGEADVRVAKHTGFTLRVSATEYLTIWEDWIRDDGTGDIPPPSLGSTESLGEIVLQAAGVVFGRATSSTGEPLAGADLYFRVPDPEDPTDTDSYPGFDPEVTTDAEGNFRAAHLLPGEVLLSLNHGMHLVNAPNTWALVIQGREIGPVTLRAKLAPIVEGHVVDTDGAPIEGVYVNGTGNWSITDSAYTGPDGHYRLGLRRDNPAEVGVFHRGWTQISPREDERHGPGTLDFVMRRDSPDGEHTVLVVDVESGANLRSAHIEVLPESSLNGADSEPSAPGQFISQPEVGLPLDYEPGQDQIRVSSKGYVTEVFSTGSHVDSAPHLTLALRPSPGITGRLLENGNPVAFERVFLSSVGLVLATPRESLERGESTRLETGIPRPKELSGRGGYSHHYVLGLDGPPPPYRLESFGSRLGTRTDAEGRFRFRATEGPVVNLHLRREGEAKRVLGPFTLERDECALGDLEIGSAASLSGHFEVHGPWFPEEYELELQPSGQEARLNADGSFEFEGLQSGDNYLRLSWDFDAAPSTNQSSFADLPVFHLAIASSERREIVINLDAYRTCNLELEFKLAGSPPAATFEVDLWPLSSDARIFEARGSVEGHLFSGRANALGPCGLRIRQATRNGGWITLECPSTILDLQPGVTIAETIEIDAGQIRMQLPLGHPAAALERLDLILEGHGKQLLVIGLRTTKPKTSPGEDGVDVVATTGWIPPGNYRARLYETTWKRDYETREPLAEFETTVRKNETSEQWLDF